MKQRFSKATLRELLEKRIGFIQEEWNFDPNDGTHQLKYTSRPLTDAAVAYGKKAAYESLLEEFEL